MSKQKIPFNIPFIAGNEAKYCLQALDSGKLSGDGPFTHQVEQLLAERLNLDSNKQAVLLTTSCTSALEMAALLAGIEAGDEVIMPSFTFVSTANAFVLRGAKVRFVDIRPDTLNMDENQITALITDKTKAIVPVHYASVPCNMAAINDIAAAHDLTVIEDAAQALNCQYQGQAAGTLSDGAAFSFHDTKNFVAGEGGALVVNREDWLERAEILREKGTNRRQFIRGQVDKYSWVDVGSSYVPSDLLAAVLLAQLEQVDMMTQKRLQIAQWYREALAPLVQSGLLQLPVIPADCTSNGHMFYVICQTPALRNLLLTGLNAHGIGAVFHYVPLHNAAFAKAQGFYEGPLPVTERTSDCLLRLPMYPQLEKAQIDFIAAQVISIATS